MDMDPAILKAMDMVLAKHPEQSESFQQFFRNLIELVLSGNYQDSDVRRVTELIRVELGDDA